MKKYKVTFRDGSSVIVNAKDSVASDLYSEIKKAYPNAQITKSVKNQTNPSGKQYRINTFEITNYSALGSGFGKFLEYLKNKYKKYDAYTTRNSIIVVEE